MKKGRQLFSPGQDVWLWDRPKNAKRYNHAIPANIASYAGDGYYMVRFGSGEELPVHVRYLTARI